MKIIVTTSDKYRHIIPIFCFLFNKYWGKQQEVEIVHYAPVPYPLPDNFKLVSLGEQIGGPENFSTDLRKYFEKQDQWFVWMMEDTFLRASVDIKSLGVLKSLCFDNVGRINLSKETVKQKYYDYLISCRGYDIFENTQTANYRLSTQPSIWNRDFLLKYLTPGLTPWKFETQSAVNDGYRILGMDTAAVPHNEGVTKKNIYDYNFDRIPQEVVNEMKELKLF